MELAFSELWYWFVLMAVVCYFIGCFNFAVIVARAKNKDVHKIGSGNPGTMNMSREFGIKIGILIFLLDACKGGIPALVSYFIFRGYTFQGTAIAVSDFTRYFCGVFVVIGHIYPVTMKFRGGKGIASTLGLYCFALSCEKLWFLPVCIACYVLLFMYIAVSEWGSMASLMGVTGLSLIQAILFALRFSGEPVGVWLVLLYVLILMLNFLTWFAHRKNLVRLFAGEEHRTSIRKLKKGKRGTENM